MVETLSVEGPQKLHVQVYRYTSMTYIESILGDTTSKYLYCTTHFGRTHFPPTNQYVTSAVSMESAISSSRKSKAKTKLHISHESAAKLAWYQYQYYHAGSIKIPVDISQHLHPECDFPPYKPNGIFRAFSSVVSVKPYPNPNPNPNPNLASHHMYIYLNDAITRFCSSPHMAL